MKRIELEQLRAQYSLPNSICQHLRNRWLTSNTIGQSNAVVVFAEDCYLKVEPRGSVEELSHEHKALAWLAGKLPVPEIVDFAELPEVTCLLTSTVPGAAIYEPAMHAIPAGDRVTALAQALRQFHSLPIEAIPFNHRLHNKLAEAKIHVERGWVDEDDFDAPRRGRSARSVYEECLERRPSIEDLVVCHGDYCLPNVLFDGLQLSGFIDLGRMGLADRYQDIALALRSLQRNFPETDYSSLFLSAYGVDSPDWERVAYYQLLDELF